MTVLNTISLSKRNLTIISRFLNGVALKGAASRSRTKLNTSIGESITDLMSDEKELLTTHHGKADDNGATTFDPQTTDKEDFNKEHTILLDETVAFTEHTEGYFAKLNTALQNTESDLNGLDAVAYDLILDSLEELEAEKAEG